MNLVVKGNTATLKSKTYKVAIGKGGYSSSKKEGDGTTPIGTYSIRKLYLRPDRIKIPIKTPFELNLLSEKDGWCDDPKSRQYNTFVKLPFKDSHEKLWREDDLYNIILVIAYNDSPPIPDKGSAIFIHVAREGYKPTEGCIAFKQADLLEVIGNLDKGSQVEILGD